MLKRLRFPAIAARRDVLLLAAATVLVFAITAVWGVLLAGRVDPFLNQNNSKYFLLLLFFAVAAAVGLLPFLTKWSRGETHRLARVCIRAGIALQLFALFASTVGLFYATDPTRSVPVGYATFTAMLFGVFVAGFAGNSLVRDQV